MKHNIIEDLQCQIKDKNRIIFQEINTNILQLEIEINKINLNNFQVIIKKLCWLLDYQWMFFEDLQNKALD